jgi:hypothetical protein
VSSQGGLSHRANPVKTVRLWPQLARHPAQTKSLWPWIAPGRLHEPRTIRVGPWVVDDDGDQVWLWTASQVAALERLPRTVHDGNPRLRGRTAAEMVEAIDMAAAGWGEIVPQLAADACPEEGIDEDDDQVGPRSISSRAPCGAEIDEPVDDPDHDRAADDVADRDGQ